jgi:hypothetical protein
MMGLRLYLRWLLRCLSVLLVLLVTLIPVAVGGGAEGTGKEESVVLQFNKVAGAGCPYTASWLVDTSLFMKAQWWMESTKMEAASFNIFDKAKLKFQLSDPDAYYVHHMSMYEHFIHKKEGFDAAQNRTKILSEAALAGECMNLTVSDSEDFMSFIPFYGGLPPNVTKDLSVKSIGQGNSLVSITCGLLQICYIA